MAKDLKVLVIMEDSLLERGILQRLTEEPGLKVRVVNDDSTRVAGTLGTFKPHVTIVQERKAPLLELILATYPQSSVVTLSFDREGATVYRARHLSVTTVKELVTSLKAEKRRASGPIKRRQRDERPA